MQLKTSSCIQTVLSSVEHEIYPEEEGKRPQFWLQLFETHRNLLPSWDLRIRVQVHIHLFLQWGMIYFAGSTGQVGPRGFWSDALLLALDTSVEAEGVL